MRSLVYLAYHASDRQWVESLQLLLRPQVRKGLQVFDPFLLPAGENLFLSVQAALDHTRVAVVLASKSLLADDVLFTDVLVPLVAARQRGDISLLWLVVGPCLHDQSPLVAFAPAHDPQEPLSLLSATQADLVLVKICKHLDPSWDGSFPIASGLVADTSHPVAMAEKKKTLLQRYAGYIAIICVARDVAIVAAIFFLTVQALLKK